MKQDIGSVVWKKDLGTKLVQLFIPLIKVNTTYCMHRQSYEGERGPIEPQGFLGKKYMQKFL